jgi:uncharacterized protein YkwD
MARKLPGKRDAYPTTREYLIVFSKGLLGKIVERSDSLLFLSVDRSQAMIRFTSAFLLILLVCLPTWAEEKKDPAERKLSANEQKLLEWTNQVRAEHKLPPLESHPLLNRLAQEHSANMARQGKMSHVLDGKTPAQRARAAGYSYASIGENIAMSDGFLLKVITEAWLKSKNHRENILATRYKEIGIGIVRNDEGDYYYTQVFGRRRQGR